jgi:hypothetical protein
MSKEAAIAYFEVQSRHFLEGSEETHEEPGRIVSVQTEIAAFLTASVSL